jgi:primosomal protein N' (replication factor Y) (superfamily II helicase)
LKISVSLSYNLFEPLTYRADAPAAAIRIGARVLVPLGKRLALGWVTDLDSPYAGRLKSIIGVIDDPYYPAAAFVEMARQTAAAYFTSSGSVLDHCLPPSQKNLKKLLLELDGRERKLAEFAPGELERQAASAPLRFYFKAATAPAPPAAAPANDGDTLPRLLLAQRREQEYNEACARTLAGGRSVILVVPDNATARYWQSAIPGVDMYHSEIKAAAKEKIWQQYRQGKRGIVCGGISALMLPLTDPGLLIVDRAASPLYSRSAGSPFRTDHLAEIRARSGRIPLLRGADSHSCSSYAQRREAGPDDRRQEPGVTCQVHMLKGRERGIPAAIVELICQSHLAQKKTLVLVNRIQPAVHLFCDRCRRIAACPRCAGNLEVDETRRASCRRCTYRQDALNDCPRCRQPLTLLRDISIDSLARAVERVCGEKSVLSLTAAELKEPQQAVAAAQASPIVIATMAALSPFFAAMFHTAIWVKPESFFNMEDFNAAEMIHASGAEIATALGKGGEMHVFSVFHFHYALQYLMDEAAFFERELKYRQWFMLPPFASVYELELRGPGLRSLAAAMRGLYGRARGELQIKRIYLASRQPQRGTYRGVLELHTSAEKIAAAGLHRIKRSSLRLTAG